MSERLYGKKRSKHGLSERFLNKSAWVVCQGFLFKNAALGSVFERFFLFVFRDVIFCKLVAMCSFGDFYAERWIWKRSFCQFATKI